MKRPAPYETVYAHDRRNHRHRCQCCRKIINAGENVLMWQMDHKTTRALHIDCADKMSFDNITHRGYAKLHSDEYAKSIGFKVTQ